MQLFKTSHFRHFNHARGIQVGYAAAQRLESAAKADSLLPFWVKTGEETWQVEGHYLLRFSALNSKITMISPYEMRGNVAGRSISQRVICKTLLA